MAYPKELSTDLCDYERVRTMTIPVDGGTITYYALILKEDFLPIHYQRDSRSGETNQTGWTLAACDELFRTWSDLVEYWPIHNSKMLAVAK